jgi:hypothetical protein
MCSFCAAITEYPRLRQFIMNRDLLFIALDTGKIQGQEACIWQGPSSGVFPWQKAEGQKNTHKTWGRGTTPMITNTLPSL